MVHINVIEAMEQCVGDVVWQAAAQRPVQSRFDQPVHGLVVRQHGELPEKGLRAFGRVYAGWGFSQAFYRHQLDLEAMGMRRSKTFWWASGKGCS